MKAMKKKQRKVESESESEAESEASQSGSSEEEASQDSGASESSSEQVKPSKKKAVKGKKRKAQEDSEDDESGDEDGSSSDEEDEKPKGKKKNDARALLDPAAVAEVKQKRRVIDNLERELKRIYAKARAKKKELKSARAQMSGVQKVEAVMNKLKNQSAANSWRNAKNRVSDLKDKIAAAKDKAKGGEQLKEKSQDKLATAEKEYKRLKKEDYHLTHQGFEAARVLKLAKAEWEKVKNQVDNAASVPELEEKLQAAKEKVQAMSAKRAADRGKGGAKAMKK